MHKIPITKYSELKPLDPTYTLLAGVDLVVAALAAALVRRP
jgi:hypothetical protein